MIVSAGAGDPLLDVGPKSDQAAASHSNQLDRQRPDYAAILQAHRCATDAGSPGYQDPSTGLFVLTASFLRERGYCCENRCRHCPYGGAGDPDAATQQLAPGGSA